MRYEIAKLESNELEMLVNGKRVSSLGEDFSCRHIFLFEDFVVKLDAGSEQNLEEVLFYDVELEDEDKQYFAKLLDWNLSLNNDESFVVQERIEINELQKPTQVQINIVAHLKEKYGLEDMHLIGMQTYSGNVGMFNHNVSPIGEDAVKIFDVGIWGDMWKD